MQRDYNGYKYDTFLGKIYFSLIRILKCKKKKLALPFLYCLSQETWLADSWKLICISQSRFYNFFHVENSKLFRKTSKYFRIFNNKSPASWVGHIITDFLTCYFYSCYSSMKSPISITKKVLFWSSSSKFLSKFKDSFSNSSSVWLGDL